MKTYEATWLDETGHFTNLGEKETETPKHWLRDLYVKMMLVATTCFEELLNGDNIMKNIIESHKSVNALMPDKERYYLMVKGKYGIQVLSVVEIKKD